MTEVLLSPHRFNESISSSASTFDQTWNLFDASTFDSSNLPLPKARRAWERVPQSPREKDARYRKVWRRHGLRSKQDEDTSDQELKDEGSYSAEDGRERAIKRLCLSNLAASEDGGNDETGAPYAGTKYDRRTSGSIHKVAEIERDQESDSTPNEGRKIMLESEKGSPQAHDQRSSNQTDEQSSTPSDDGINTTTHLELDTALLKDFLSRAAAAKASKKDPGKPRLSVERRSSLMNRRDSDAIRQALASPQKALDDKDPNSSMTAPPAKVLCLPGVKELAAQLPPRFGATSSTVGSDTTGVDLSAPPSAAAGSRRSTRTRSRLPAPSAAAEKTPSKTIPVKRTADGSDPTAVVIKKTEAQELSILTRNNTRRNKGSSVSRQARLKRLRDDGMAPEWVEGKVKDMPAINPAAIDGPPAEGSVDADDQQPWRVPAEGEKGVRWRPKEKLRSFFEQPEQQAKPATKLPTVVQKERKSKLLTPKKVKLTPVGLMAAEAKEDKEKKERRLASPRKMPRKQA